MTNTLILVKKTDGEKKNYSLDLTNTLEAVRKILTNDGFMYVDDVFIVNDATIDIAAEKNTTLDVIVGVKGKKPLLLGTVEGGLENPDKTVDRYNSLNMQQKLALFNNVQIYHGITASSKNGIEKSFKPCIVNWHESQMPNSKNAYYVSQVIIDESFSEVEKSFSITNTDKMSASINTPYGGGKTSFEYMKSRSKTSKEVKTYLTGKFLINKVDLEVELKNIQLADDFYQEMLVAVKSGSDIDQYENIVKVLNNRGYYVPIKFTIGGMIYSESSTEVSTYKEVEKEKKDFSVGFKLAIDGFGGGSDYSHSTETESSTSTTQKYSNLNIIKKGGRPDCVKYEAWTKSLNPAINWDVIKYDKLYPTLALLPDKRLIRYCIQLLDTYNTYSTVKDLQQVFNIGKYTTQVEYELSQGGSGIG